MSNGNLIGRRGAVEHSTEGSMGVKSLLVRLARPRP